jgi:hypothetical protein
MDKNDILKIAIATALAVVLKEVLTWLIRVSKPVAAVAAKLFGKWLLSHAFLIEFIVDCGLLIIFVAIFCLYPHDGTEVTFNAIRVQIFMGMMAAFQIHLVANSVRKWVYNKFTK